MSYSVQIYIGEAVGIGEFQSLDEAMSYADSVSEGTDEIVILDSQGDEVYSYEAPRFLVHVYDDNSETPDICGPFTSEADASEFVSKQTLSVSAVIVPVP